MHEPLLAGRGNAGRQGVEGDGVSMTPEGRRPDMAIDPREALNLLEAGHLPAMAVDAPEHLICAINDSLTESLGVDADAIEGERMHKIVAEEHHEFLEAMLNKVARGVTVGPTWISLRPPGADAAQPCIFTRIPCVWQGVKRSVVFLCKPAEAAEVQASLDPKGDLGFGRIPPFPGCRWRRPGAVALPGCVRAPRCRRTRPPGGSAGPRQGPNAVGGRPRWAREGDGGPSALSP